jgi:hypothetical protein
MYHASHDFTPTTCNVQQIAVAMEPITCSASMVSIHRPWHQIEEHMDGCTRMEHALDWLVKCLSCTEIYSVSTKHYTINWIIFSVSMAYNHALLLAAHGLSKPAPSKQTK